MDSFQQVDGVNSQAIEEAGERLGDHVIETPLTKSDYLSSSYGDPVFLKLENLQRSGSFKIRGATNAILENEHKAKNNGVIAASAGNHSQGVAFGARLVGCDAEIIMPRSTPDNKIVATENLGANVRLEGSNYDEAYEVALMRRDETNKLMVHPYDDPSVITGQGTVAREITQENINLNWIIVPVGGGGLISGISVWLRKHSPDTTIFPVQCHQSSSLDSAMKNGSPVDVPPPDTIAEGIATGRVGNNTFEIMSQLVEEPLLVDDEDMISAIKTLVEEEKIISEGAGAAPLAAFNRYHGKLPDGPGCLLVGGGNLDVLEVIQFLERGLRQDGRLIRLATELKDEPGALSNLSGLIGEVGGNIQFIHHDRSDLGVGARRAKVHIEISVRSRELGEKLLDRLRDEGYSVNILEL